ncbi:MAG: amidohydrolase family protein, partial [Deltaproteobacteria bacterium]|nr:amidohydrolase family protein [Deltaproteobacteria bacterium]
MQSPIIQWVQSEQHDNRQPRVAYRGPLEGNNLRLHYGFDGWQEPVHETRLEPISSGLAMSEPLFVAGHISLECVVTDGSRWDNNLNANYRLWIDFEPLDAHLHVSGRGSGELGLSSLRTAMASAGIGYGIVSWYENRALDRVKGLATNLFPLVWVRPGETTREEVRARLTDGFIGLKLHPTVDDYRADDHDLDRYLEIAAEVGCPVACHSAPGEADPDHIRRLAERFPTVPVILYHTYLGP